MKVWQHVKRNSGFDIDFIKEMSEYYTAMLAAWGVTSAFLLTLPESLLTASVLDKEISFDDNGHITANWFPHEDPIYCRYFEYYAQHRLPRQAKGIQDGKTD